MNLRWLIYDHINPELGLNRAKRRAMRKRARQVASVDRTFADDCLLAAAALISVASVFAWFQTYGPVEANIQQVLPIAIPSGWTFIILLGALHVLGAWLYRRRFERATRLTLRETGYDVCIQCGYWLKGLDERTPTCPECGSDRSRPLAEPLASPPGDPPATTAPTDRSQTTTIKR